MEQTSRQRLQSILDHITDDPDELEVFSKAKIFLIEAVGSKDMTFFQSEDLNKETILNIIFFEENSLYHYTFMYGHTYKVNKINKANWHIVSMRIENGRTKNIQCRY